MKSRVHNMITWENIAYAAPALPVFVYIGLFIRHRARLFEVVRSQGMAAERESYRALYLGLLGFDFAGLLVLAVVDKVTRQSLALPIYFLAVGSVCYYAALTSLKNMAKRWQTELRELFADTGSLALVLSICTVVLAVHVAAGIVLTCAIGLIWLFDFLRIRWQMDTYLRTPAIPPSARPPPMVVLSSSINTPILSDEVRGGTEVTNNES